MSRQVEVKKLEIPGADGKSMSAAIVGSSDTPNSSYLAIDAIVKKLQKAVEPVKGSSNQDDTALEQGQWFPRFDMQAAKELTKNNPHHSTCLGVKRDATVGLGFVNVGEEPGNAEVTGLEPGGIQEMLLKQIPVESKVDKVLDPLCDDSFQDVINDVAEDHWTLGQGYIEVVRETPGDQRSPITGLYPIPGESTTYWRHGGHKYHFVVNVDGEEKHWPRFGRIAEFQELIKRSGRVGVIQEGAPISEVIPFKSSSSRDQYYGMPGWLSAVADIELSAALRQFKLDFYYNRGVPEYIFLYKGDMDDPEWNKVVQQLTGNVGIGKSHKSVVMKTPPNPDTGLEIIRLAMDNFNGEEEFKDTKDALDMGIITAHRVPPLLGGIQIPGKMGAANEFVQQLTSFQALLINHAQRLFQRNLGQTLGNSTFAPGLGLTQEDFRLRRITDVLDTGSLDTVSRMRQSPQSAQAEGRDISEGVRD